MSAALIVVDMQCLFVRAVGEHGPRVLDAVNRRADAMLAAGGSVFYTRDVRPTDAPADDAANDLHPDLRLLGPVVEKGPGRDGGFSGFLLRPRDAGFGEGALGPLAGHLVQAGATSVTVVGIAADVCVAATARDAVRLGYPTEVPLEATAFIGGHPGGEAAAVAELRDAGVVVTG